MVSVKSKVRRIIDEVYSTSVKIELKDKYLMTSRLILSNLDIDDNRSVNELESVLAEKSSLILKDDEFEDIFLEIIKLINRRANK